MVMKEEQKLFIITKTSLLEDIIAEEDVVVTISHSGFIKRFPVSGYRKQGQRRQRV